MMRLPRRAHSERTNMCAHVHYSILLMDGNPNIVVGFCTPDFPNHEEVRCVHPYPKSGSVLFCDDHGWLSLMAQKEQWPEPAVDPEKKAFISYAHGKLLQIDD